MALEQARYEVGRARRQYDAVDPDNRLVAAELEKHWNERLATARDLEAELEGLAAFPAATLSPQDRERLMTLGADLDYGATHLDENAFGDDQKRLQSRDGLRQKTFAKIFVGALTSQRERRESNLFQSDGGRKQDAPLA